MRRMLVILIGLSVVAAASSYAGAIPKTQVARVLEYKSSLGLTDAQIKKLEVIDKNAIEKMVEAQGQANIRLQEIERFTANWTNLNGTSVRQLIQEYYGFMAEFKTAEVNAIIQARAIMKPDQLSKYQQLASIDALMISMENNLALK